MLVSPKLQQFVMPATKKDQSGVFDGAVRSRQVRTAATLDHGFQLTTKGITFVSQEYLPEWTEVGIEMRLPQADPAPASTCQIDCHGVVVQCSKRPNGGGFSLALLFLDLPKNAQERLASPSANDWPASISISR